MNAVQNILTCGDFTEEFVGLEAFDRAVERSGAFKIYREVCGHYVQPRFDSELKTARIDRVLVPTAPAIAAGWRDGFIGVEGKKSGHKLGKIVSQSLDYSRCVWELPPNGFTIVLRWVFIWPLVAPKGDIESVMAQNRIGSVGLSGSRLVFNCGGTNGIVIDGSGAVSAKSLPMGRKAGSR